MSTTDRTRFITTPLVLMACCVATAMPPGSQVSATRPTGIHVDPAQLCGRIDHVGRLPVLYLWGSPEERGAAQGYLLAGEIHAMLSEYLDDRALSGGPTIYENVTLRMITSPALRRPPHIDEELRGMLAGIRARLGDKGAVVESLKRPIGMPDLMAFQSASDAPPLGCSSFAAWGKLTESGKTIAARNLDWFASKCLLNHRVLVVRAADPAAGRLGWVSLTWAGAIGCYTGMNQEGVTLCIHDVPRGLMRSAVGMTPRPLVLREAIETSHASTATSDIQSVLQSNRIMMGTNVPAAMPATAGRAPSVVFEYDGRGEPNGVTARNPESGHDWQICTNHFRRRSAAQADSPVEAGAAARSDPARTTEIDASVEPRATDNTMGRCARYDRLHDRILRAVERQERIDVPTAWKLLRSVSFDGSSRRLMTLQSVVFEPDARRMHVAVAQSDAAAPRQKPITIDVTALLRQAAASPP